jgi:hypothetical protein
MLLSEGLSTTLRLEPQTAQALAGGMLLLLEDVMRRRQSPVAASLRKAIPELNDWQTLTPTLPVGTITAAMLANAATDEGEFALLLTRFSIAGADHHTVRKLVRGFLAERIGSAGLEQVTAAAPWLLN